jgi:hypothetical protein
MKWYAKLKRAKGLPGLDGKIRQFKLDYIETKKSQGGFLKEGELAFLDEVRKDPITWDLSKVREQVYSQLFRTIWHEDDEPEDATPFPLFAVAGIDVERTLTIPDAATHMRKVSSRWATASQAQRRADMIELKAEQNFAKAQRIRQIGENALARGAGDPATLLYDVRDGTALPLRPRSSSPRPTPPAPPTP